MPVDAGVVLECLSFPDSVGVGDFVGDRVAEWSGVVSELGPFASDGAADRVGVGVGVPVDGGVALE